MNFRSYEARLPFDALAENLVNSHDVSLQEPEHLRSLADLADFLRRHDVAPGRRLTHADLEATRRLRGEIRALFEARSEAQALRLLNEMLLHARPRLAIARDADGWSLLWDTQSAVDFDGLLRSAVAINLAHVVARFGFLRLRVCEASPCEDVFLDLSKKGEQRFCGPKCATRTRVAAYRARQEE